MGYYKLQLVTGVQRNSIFLNADFFLFNKHLVSACLKKFFPMHAAKST